MMVGQVALWPDKAQAIVKYRKSGNFRVKNFKCDNFFMLKYFRTRAGHTKIF